MHNITNDAIIPPHRNGPNGKTSLLPAFLKSTIPAAQTPPAAKPSNTASTFPSSPRNNPPAAASLISPPPNPPDVTIATRSIGTLTANIPKTLSTISGPGTVNIAQPPVRNTARFIRSGIRIVLKSFHPITASSTKNVKTVARQTTLCNLSSPPVHLQYPLSFLKISLRSCDCLFRDKESYPTHNGRSPFC